MKCLVLAAGYATRLYPLTENFPKPLLKVGDRTILDYLLDDIAESGAVTEYAVVTNHKFAAHFSAWAVTKPYRVAVVDDNTTTNETRLGAVRDIQYAVDALGWDDDLLVIAGDNVLDFSLGIFIKYAAEKRTSCVMRYYEQSVQKLRKTGVLTVDGEDRILSMEEKPVEPKSNWCCPPFYFYTREDAARLGEGIRSGCGTDAPGSFIAWLSALSLVHSMEMPGRRYDIGNLESYEQAQMEYKGIIIKAIPHNTSAASAG